MRSGAVEPLTYSGIVKEYFYNYRAYLPDKTMLPAQFGMRLTAGGKRANPYLIVRWVRVNAIAEKDLVGIRELVGEITGATNFDAAKFVLDFSASKPHAGAGPVTHNREFRCLVYLHSVQERADYVVNQCGPQRAC